MLEDSIEKELERFSEKQIKQTPSLEIDFTNQCMKTIAESELKTDPQNFKNWASQLYYTTLAVTCCLGLPFVFFPPDDLTSYSPEKDWSESIEAFHQAMAEFSELIASDTSGLALIFALGVLGVGVKLLVGPGSKLKKIALLLVSLNTLGFMGKFLFTGF